MAKDPAFLFYTNDFDAATKFYTDEQVGVYLRLLMAQHQHGRLKESQVKFICKSLDNEVLEHFNKDESGLYYNNRLELEVEKRKKYSESRRQSRLKSDEDQVKIYLILDRETGYYKIGSSVNPLRRFSEMCNQKNPAITVGNRDYELFWVSEVCERTTEAEMHKSFKSKRITGEWFSLNKDDLEHIDKTYVGTYVNRTIPRTENENENTYNNTLTNNNNKESENLKKWPTMPKPEDVGELPEIKIGSAIQLLKLTKQTTVTDESMIGMWAVFKAQKLTGKKFYQDIDEVYSHFINWVKDQKFETNGTGKSIKDRQKSARDNLREQGRESYLASIREADNRA